MQDPWLGEIALVAFGFAPTGWAFCNGQLLSISQNTALFSLLGTTYGGDGVSNFALPNLQSRVPLHFGQGTGLSPYVLGQTVGVESVTLETAQIPSHTHSYAPQANSAPGSASSPAGALWAASASGDTLYKPGASNASMAAQTLGSTGGGQAHENRQPSLALNFVILCRGFSRADPEPRSAKGDSLMGRRYTLATVLGLTVAIGLAEVATAGPVKPGDLIVTDFVNGTVDDVNPTTGASVVIASGFTNPQGVAVNAQGIIFISDIGTNMIDQVNPTTGVVTVFSGAGVGTGPVVQRPFEMAFVGNTLYVADGGTPNGDTSAVYTVDAAGNRHLVAGNNGTSDNLFGIGGVAGLAVTSTGAIYASAASPSVHTIYSVAPGTATPLTTTITAPQGLAIGGNGQILAVSGGPINPSIWSINPTTGVATDIADNNGVGTGAAFSNLRGITYDNGMIYVTDLGTSGNPQIDMVNPANGDRTVISGNGIGGTTFGQLSYGIAVYPAISPTPTVPEPSSLALLARRRRRSGHRRPPAG